MHARRLVGLLVLSIPGVVRADDAPPAPAPVVPGLAAAPAPWPVTFQTTEVSNDPTPADKFRATQDFEPIDFDEALPSGVTAPAEPGRVAYGHVGSTKRSTIAVVRGEGDSLTVFVDANGDGKFGEDERSVATATPMTTGPANAPTRLGTTWKVPSVKTAGAPLLLVLREAMARWAGVLSPPAAAPNGPTPAGDLRLDWKDTAPAGAKPPADFGAPVRWATGEYQAQGVVVAVAPGADGALHAAMTTADKPGDLATAKVATAKPNELTQDNVHAGTRWSFEGFEGGGLRGSLTVVETLRTLTGRFNAATTRRGSADVAGMKWVVLLVDGDHDGRFDSKRDLWYVGPAVTFKSATYATMFEANEPFRSVGPPAAAYRLVSVDDKGAAVVALESNPGSLTEYLERRAERVNETWFKRFRRDGDFMTKFAIDPKRPKATTPAHFRYAADFEEAKALAAKEGKPLLVDFEADWCIWCKRLDFYTYPDAAVAERLTNFTLVKISTDFDTSKSVSKIADKYGLDTWGGLPAVGVFHADGVPVSFVIEEKKRDGKPAGPVTVDHISGFSTPVELVAQLESAHAAWKAGARATPQAKASPPPAPSTGPAPAPGMGAAPAK